MSRSSVTDTDVPANTVPSFAGSDRYNTGDPKLRDNASAFRMYT